MRFHGLWTTQVMSVRSIEISRIVRALVTLSALALVLERKAPTNLRVVNLVFAASIGWSFSACGARPTGHSSTPSDVAAASRRAWWSWVLVVRRTN